MDQDPGRNVQHVIFSISNPIQFREAVSRLRVLEDAAEDSPLGRERAALELAVSRYLATKDS